MSRRDRGSSGAQKLRSLESRSWQWREDPRINEAAIIFARISRRGPTARRHSWHDLARDRYALASGMLGIALKPM